MGLLDDIRNLPFPVEFRYTPDGKFHPEYKVQVHDYAEQIYLDEFPDPNQPITVLVDGLPYFQGETWPPLPGFFFFDRVTASVWLPANSEAKKVEIRYYGIGAIVRASYYRDLKETLEKAVEYITDLGNQVQQTLEKLQGYDSRLRTAESKISSLEDQTMILRDKVDDIESKYPYLNSPSDGTFMEGLFPWLPSTKIADALDEVNEYLRTIDTALGLFSRQDVEFSEPLWQKAVSTHSFDDYGPAVVVGQNAECELTLKGVLTRRTLRYVLDDKEVDSITFETALDATKEYTSTYMHITPEGFADDFRPQYRVKLSLPPLEPNRHTIRLQLVAQDTVATEKVFSFVMESEDTPQLSYQVVAIATEEIYLTGQRYIKNGTIRTYIAPTDNDLTYRKPNIVVVLENDVHELSVKPGSAGEFDLPIPKGIHLNGLNLQILALDTTFDFTGLATSVSGTVEGQFANVEFIPSTETQEFFYDENYRIPQNCLSTPAPYIFPSTSLPLPTDALVIPGKLARNPVGATEQYYYRLFIIGGPYSNGYVLLKGSFSLGEDLVLSLMIPNRTGWLDLHSYFDSRTFTGMDGQGCLVGVESDAEQTKLYWSIGEFNTDRVVLRIMLKDNAYLTYLEVAHEPLSTGVIA